MTLKETALNIAETQLGVTEHPKGSNTGPEVNQYLKSVGLNPGYSWCMAFVYWCFNEAAKELKMDNPLIKTGGVLNHYNRVKVHATVKTSNIPTVGDIFIMDFGQGLGHTGIVTKVDGSYIETIEGNSDANGSRTGGSVVRNKRPISKIKSFINYEYHRNL